ncbi:MAG: Asp-tRNA(Asn)/Glu-tRNA(Gln) amidotransferase subunit GatB, partial [Propionibacteriaceae bacterium]
MDDLLTYGEALERFDPVLGLEVHVELNTASKMFCGCTNHFGSEPNTNTCPVCLGLPGSLPALNGKAVESAIRLGLALGCSIAPRCRFARKNYFYPDMTKDFQTSQYDEPIAFEGVVEVEVEGQTFRIEIERAHMEEDAGKLVHQGTSGRIHGADYSLVDYNRAGTPLVEIVTKPIRGTGTLAPQVAKAYVDYVRDTVLALGVSDAKMEQGSLRCDANVSLMPKGSDVLGTRTETKNVNSLRSIEAALTYEIRRQGAVLAEGGRVIQETRMWHEEGYTTAGRSKEQAEDYRYFPEPDLVPIVADAEWVERLRATLPEPPAERRRRLQADWGFTDLEFRDVVNGGALDAVADTVAAGCPPQAARKWWTAELA